MKKIVITLALFYTMGIELPSLYAANAVYYYRAERVLGDEAGNVRVWVGKDETDSREIRNPREAEALRQVMLTGQDQECQEAIRIAIANNPRLEEVKKKENKVSAPEEKKDIKAATKNPENLDENQSWVAECYDKHPIITVLTGAGIVVTAAMIIDYAIRKEESFIYIMYAKLVGKTETAVKERTSCE